MRYVPNIMILKYEITEILQTALFQSKKLSYNISAFNYILNNPGFHETRQTEL